MFLLLVSPTLRYSPTFLYFTCGNRIVQRKDPALIVVVDTKVASWITKRAV